MRKRKKKKKGRNITQSLTRLCYFFLLLNVCYFYHVEILFAILVPKIKKSTVETRKGSRMGRVQRHRGDTKV